MNWILNSYQAENDVLLETNDSEIPNSQIDTQLPNDYSDVWIKCQYKFRNSKSIDDKNNIRDQMRNIKFVSSVLVSLRSLVDNVQETERMIERDMKMVKKWQSYLKQMEDDGLLTKETLLKIGEDEDFKDHVLEVLQNLKQSCQDYSQETAFEE